MIKAPAVVAAKVDPMVFQLYYSLGNVLLQLLCCRVQYPTPVVRCRHRAGHVPGAHRGRLRVELVSLVVCVKHPVHCTLSVPCHEHFFCDLFRSCCPVSAWLSWGSLGAALWITTGLGAYMAIRCLGLSVACAVWAGETMVCV